MSYSTKIPSYEDLRGFSEVYLRAVALAWEDSEAGRAFKRMFLERTEEALEMYFNYKCPWSVELKVREAIKERPDAGWKADAPDGGQWNLPENRVIFSLPEKPDDDLNESIALAAYVDGGRTYLFSCC